MSLLKESDLPESDLPGQLFKHFCHVHLFVDSNIRTVLLSDLLVAANHPNRFVNSSSAYLTLLRVSNLVIMNIKFTPGASPEQNFDAAAVACFVLFENFQIYRCFHDSMIIL